MKIFQARKENSDIGFTTFEPLHSRLSYESMGLKIRLSSKILRTYTLYSLICIFAFSEAHAQSFAYKTLLKTLYDSEFPVIYPEEIERTDEFQILDTREKEEFEVSHLPNATWVGYETFSLQNVRNLDKNKPVLVYCTVGARSQEIGEKLKTAGFAEVYNLYGGIIHWANEDYPLYHNTRETNRIHTYTQAWGIWLKKGEKVY